MTLVILFSLKTVESLQIGVAVHFQVTLLFSMRRELLVSSQSCRSVDTDVRCKWTISVNSYIDMIVKFLSDITKRDPLCKCAQTSIFPVGWCELHHTDLSDPSVCDIAIADADVQRQPAINNSNSVTGNLIYSP